MFVKSKKCQKVGVGGLFEKTKEMTVFPMRYGVCVAYPLAQIIYPVQTPLYIMPPTEGMVLFICIRQHNKGVNVDFSRNVYHQVIIIAPI